MDISEAVADFLSDKRKVLTPLTLRGYQERLDVFVEFCKEKSVSLEQVRNKTINDFLDHLTRTRTPHASNRKQLSQITLHGYIRVIKSFLRWCSLDEDMYEGVVKEKTVERIALPKVESIVIDPFTEEHIKKLLKACDKAKDEHLRLRDRCIVLVLLNTGIRANELCTLKIKDTHLEADDPYIKVMGKGSKEREVNLDKETRLELRRYIRKYRANASITDSTFVSRNLKDPLGVWGLDEVFSRLNEWAGIKDVRVSPHTMRHTYASRWMKNGGDVYKLSKTLGHSSIKTTEEYLKSITSRDVRRSS